jgi:hypothetical protein
LAAEGGWNSQFGFSVAGGGDVNGDGYADVMGGAPYFYEGGGGYDMGRGLLFFGGSPMDATAEAAFGSGDLRAHGGWSVAILGDVNGDGLADFAVASPDEPAAATRGIVRIHYGAGSWAWAADLTLRPGADVVRLGHAVAGAGDVNGDGYDDVIVGAPDSAGGTGRALIYLGGAAPDTVEDVTFSAATADQLGYAVGGVGDVNGDGYADVLLGAPYYDGAGPDVGRVHGCWGGVAPGAACDSRAGLASGDLSGYAVGGAP